MNESFSTCFEDAYGITLGIWIGKRLRSPVVSLFAVV